MTSRATVVFLGGLGRSGSTLVERLLGELPGACPLGEVVHVWVRGVRDDERCGCSRRFSQCPFWRRVGEVAYGGWPNADIARVLRLAGTVERMRFVPRLAWGRRKGRFGESVLEYAAHYLRVYRAALRVSGASVVIDSSKHASLAFCLSRMPAVDLRVVQVVRDSRGVAYSWTKHVPRPETDGAQEMTRYPPVRSALLWNAHNAAFSLLARRGVPVHRVRYERFLDDPVAQLRRLAAFAGLRVTDTDLAFLDRTSASLGPCHSAAGNPMRFATGSVHLRRDDTWRSELSAGQRRLVAAVTAPLLLAYGYPLRPAPDGRRP